MADIELVVKIPEVEYEHLTNKEKFYSLEKNKQEWLINKILNYVIDGTPLPKGHGRLIDADKFINDFAYYGYIEAMNVDYFRAVVPTIIEADKEL